MGAIFYLLAPEMFRLFCPAEQVEVSRDEVVKGFEISKGQHVVVTWPPWMVTVAAEVTSSFHIV